MLLIRLHPTIQGTTNCIEAASGRNVSKTQEHIQMYMAPRTL